VYYQQYVKNPQLRILPVSTSARPQIRTSAFYHWPKCSAPYGATYMGVRCITARGPLKVTSRRWD